MSAAIIPGTRPEIIKMSRVIRECERRGMEYFILREERKAQPHKSLNSEDIIRTGTRITRIRTDTIIRAHPGDPCSIVNNLKGKISYQWLFYPVIEQGVAQ